MQAGQPAWTPERRVLPLAAAQQDGPENEGGQERNGRADAYAGGPIAQLDPCFPAGTSAA
jgi:hypothetical protein